jgi:inosine-uridine nucleoside N-ribohydrolase
MNKIPIILDTDIGGDIDDTWALAMLLRSPELDLKLIVTSSGDTTYRAKIAAKLLQLAGRANVPVGIGIPLQSLPCNQAGWVDGYRLAHYPGTIKQDGIGALIEAIMSASEPVTLLCLGPLPNIAAALRREPRIAKRARFVGMHGSLRRGYNGRPEPSAEYNVKAYPLACREVFTAPWDITITPLDTCGLVALQGQKYRVVRDCPDPLARALIDNYRIWAQSVKWTQAVPDERSSVLFDTVAVYLAFSQALLEMEELPVAVTDDGFTIVEDGAKMMNCATGWRDLESFEDLLVERLTGDTWR